MGINKPHKKTIGKRKKLENVCASKTSLTETAMNSPKKVEVTAIKMTLNMTIPQLIFERGMKNKAMRIGTNAFTMPNKIAPSVFASISQVRLMGESSSLSNERLRRSKVMVTASMDVAPNRIDIAITPGRTDRTSTGDWDLKKNISIQAKGKIMPQLILGGFR